MRLRLWQRERDLGGDRAHAVERTQQVLTADGQRQEVEYAELLRPQHQAHGGPVRGGQQLRAPRGTAQRLHPPRHIVVGPLAQDREHHVPALRGELAHRAGQVRGGLYVDAQVRSPLPQALQQGTAALPRHHQDPQRAGLCSALCRR